MKTDAPFDACTAICDEHERLTLDYHRAQAAFRKAVLDGQGDLSTLKKLANEKKAKLDRYVLRRGQRAIDIAYKKTARINYQKQPNLSPVAVKTSRDEEILATKSALTRHFEAMRGKPLEVELELLDHYVRLHLMHEGVRSLTFTYAKIRPQEGPKHLLMFCEWTLDAPTVASASAGKATEPHRFILPLAVHVATEVKAKELAEWVFYSLAEQHFQSPVADASERVSGVVEALRDLKVIEDDRLTKDYPEVAHTVAGATVAGMKKSHTERAR